MDVTSTVTMITQLGFSIVMCILLWNYIQKLNETILTIVSAHNEEVAGLKDMINSNTIALTELRDAINNMDKGK